MRSKAELLLLGIDVGTSLIKVGAYDRQGNVRGIQRSPQRVLRPRPGWAEMDPRDWWRKIRLGVRKLLRESGIRAEQVASIGISGLCPCAMLLDREGNPITPAVFHQDRRSQGIWQRLPSDIVRKASRITGNPVLPGTASVLSLLWFRKHLGTQSARGIAFGHANTFLGMKLTGALGIDGSQAALSGLLDVRTGSWSEELCAMFAVEDRLLPPLLPSSAKLGGLSAAAAKALGLRSGIPVCIGGADTACTALGLGKGNRGDAFLVSGTTDVLGAVVCPPVTDRQLIVRPHVLSNAWLLLGVVSSAGASLHWAKRVLKLSASDLALAESTLDAPLFLPHLAGERTGTCDPAAGGALVGFGLETTARDLWTAVLEGTAMGLRQALELIESRIGVALPALACAGGGAGDRQWLQIKADVLQRPLATACQEEAALFGAALLGGMAAGIYGTEQEVLAIAGRMKTTSLVRPDAARAELYDRRYRAFKQCSARLRAVFSQLSRIGDSPLKTHD